MHIRCRRCGLLCRARGGRRRGCRRRRRRSGHDRRRRRGFDLDLRVVQLELDLAQTAGPERVHQLERDVLQFLDIHSLRYTFLNRMQALWPPKPSELEIATLTGVSTAVLGVMSRSHSGSGSL